MARTTTGCGAAPTASDGAAASSDPQTANPPSTGTRKEQFASARDTGDDLNSGGLVAPVSPSSLLAGSVISASLITGLNSDLPGMVTAQVTQNVFDTVTGNILLVPQANRLIGKYDSVIAFGQRRALVIWQRLILPDGSSVRLDNMPAIDPGGYAGLADKADFHTWTLLKGVAIATLLGVGSELSISGESDLVQAIRESAQSNTARAGDQITQRNLDIQPTITIRPGAPVRVLVTRDLILAPWRGRQADMADLKLGKLPDRTPVKLTITITPDLQSSLQAYASVYAATYGVEEPVVDLTPAMLRAFLDSDRAFDQTRAAAGGTVK